MIEIENFEGKIMINEPLANHTTWRIGGNAKYYLIPSDEKDLEIAIEYAKKNGIFWCVIGNGSNVLFPDEGIDGIVLDLKGLKSKGCINYDREEVIVYFGAGILSGEMIAYIIKMELEGLEFLAGIPGTIGGFLKMNAGAFGSEISKGTLWINLFVQEKGMITLKKDKLDFSYRKLNVPKDSVILGGAFSLRRSSKAEIRNRVENYLNKRRNSQPYGQPSCGSVFKNPPDNYAGKLIEEVGLKGFQVGGARVSEVHANFIVNTGNATSKDILTLIELIKQKVWLKKGIMLEEEIVQINIQKQVRAKVL